MKKYLVIALFAACAFPAFAESQNPTYQYCYRQYCTGNHRVFSVRCGALNWFSPKFIQVPSRFRNNHDAYFWCAANIPSF